MKKLLPRSARRLSYMERIAGGTLENAHLRRSACHLRLVDVVSKSRFYPSLKLLRLFKSTAPYPKARTSGYIATDNT